MAVDLSALTADLATECADLDRVLEALAEADDRPPVVKLAVREMPVSGKPEELIHAAGIDAEAIAGAARRLAGTPAPA